MTERTRTTARGGVRTAATLAAMAGVFGASLVGATEESGSSDDVVSVLTIERAALADLLVDSKDQALKDALGMIPARVQELRGELPMDIPPEIFPVVGLVLKSIAEPARFSLTYNAENPSSAYGYGLVASVQTEGEEHAGQLHATVGGLLAQANLPFDGYQSESWPDMVEFQTPVAPVSYGPRRSGAGWNYEVIAGSVDDPDEAFGSLPGAPRGLNTIVRARVDLAGLTPAVHMALAAAGDEVPPQVHDLLPALEKIGLMGSDAISIDSVMGYTQDRSVAITSINDLRRLVDWAKLPTDNLTPQDLAIVPSDAYTASIGKGDFEFLVHALDLATDAGVPVPDVLWQFREATGVDLVDDLLKNIGGTMAIYTSESTGGGFFGSAVMALQLRDHDGFASANNKLVAFANAMAGQIPVAGRYIRMHNWSHGGLDLYTLRFPGVPVPLELTYAITGNYLVAGFTPQAAITGGMQASGRGDRGLINNIGFRAMLPKERPITSVTFYDTQVLMKYGYTPVSMVGSAISNLARSPNGDGRDPGLVVPTYKELRSGAKSSVTYSYWEGDDLVFEAHADRSMLVNAAMEFGASGGVWMMMMSGFMQGMAEGMGRNQWGAADLEPFDVAWTALQRASFTPNPARVLADLAGLGNGGNVLSWPTYSLLQHVIETPH